MGLNESFETVRSHILMLEPFPSMSKVYALVLQEESHKGIGHGFAFTPRPDSVAMYANTKGNSGIKVVLRRRDLCALIVTCLDTPWTSVTSSMDIHQVTSTKASLIPMLTRHILKVKLLRFLLMQLLSVLFLRHSVNNCLLFSILELIKVLITMLQV